MATNYPTTLDTTTQLPNTRANGTATATNHIADHNNLADAVIAVETALGITPSTTSFATVASAISTQLVRRWSPGTAIAETIPRMLVNGIFTVPVAATNQYLIGGCVAPAGKVVTNINYVAQTAGAVPTVSWLALARQSDRVVMAHTANITTAPTINVITTRAFAAAWTPAADTPVWVVLSYVNATTAMVLYSQAGIGTSVAGMNFITPVVFGQNAVTPTTSLPTDTSTIITAATAGVATSATVGIPYVWLT